MEATGNLRERRKMTNLKDIVRDFAHDFANHVLVIDRKLTKEEEIGLETLLDQYMESIKTRIIG